LKLEIYHDSSGFETLRPMWNALLGQNATNEIFLTWEWQATWWNAYCPGELWLIAGYENDQLVGIAAWFVEAGTRTLRSVGGVDVTDYLDVIAAPEHRDAFLKAVAAQIATKADQFARVSLCNIQEKSPTLEALPRYLREQGFFVELEQQETCPHIPLPATFEDYLNNILDKKNRHELRRKIRRVENPEGGDKVAWYVVGEQHDLNAEIEKFIDLMRASHPEKAKFMDDPKNALFFRDIVPKMAASGWLQLAFLTVNDVPAAAYLNFDYDNRIGVYNSGLLPQTYAHLSPGIVLLGYLIQYNIELKRSVFDFLRGNEDYKYRMGAVDAPVMELKASRSPAKPKEE
jgi:CelD/BcsL family acetyltransferase involved in cellulose biosynthesis